MYKNMDVYSSMSKRTMSHILVKSIGTVHLLFSRIIFFMEWHSTVLSYFQPPLSSSLRQIATFLYSRVAFYHVQLLSHSSSTRQNPTLLYSKVASYHVELLKVACHGRMLLCYITEWHSTVLSYFQSLLSSSTW